MKKRGGNDGNEGDDLPLLPLSNGPLKPKLKTKPLLGDMGDPRVQRILEEGEKLRKNGFKKRKDLDESGLLSEHSIRRLLAGLAKLKSTSEKGSEPFEEFLESLKNMKYRGELKEENYRALGNAIENAAEMTLEAAIKEKNEVIRAVYILLFFDLYTLRFRFSGLDYKLKLSEKSISDRLIEFGIKGIFFGLLKEFIDLLRDYLSNGDGGSAIDYILDILEETCHRYNK